MLWKSHRPRRVHFWNVVIVGKSQRESALAVLWWGDERKREEEVKESFVNQIVMNTKSGWNKICCSTLPITSAMWIQCFVSVCLLYLQCNIFSLTSSCFRQVWVYLSRSEVSAFTLVQSKWNFVCGALIIKKTNDEIQQHLFPETMSPLLWIPPHNHQAMGTFFCREYFQ